MRSCVHPASAEAIVGHGDRKKDVRSLYLSISDADLLDAIDRMRFDFGDTDIRVTVWDKRNEGFNDEPLPSSEHHAASNGAE